jgi:hypothetical protein
MKTGDEITLGALRREHARMSKIADKAKAEVDEHNGITGEAFAIHREFIEIVNAKDHGPHVIQQLDALKRRRARVDSILAKDYLKLLDRQFEAEWERNQVAQEIGTIEFRMSLRKSG